jgi:hypothetical protein
LGLISIFSKNNFTTCKLRNAALEGKHNFKALRGIKDKIVNQFVRQICLGSFEIVRIVTLSFLFGLIVVIIIISPHNLVKDKLQIESKHSQKSRNQGSISSTI